MNQAANPEQSKNATPSGGSAAGEEVLWLDRRAYEELRATATALRSRTDAASLVGLEKESVDAFLYWEARLLDSKHYRQWTDLLTTDFIYWIPASPEAVDPRLEGAINFDDRRRIIDRIGLIETNVQWAQVPRSRTCRMITNIEAFPGSDNIVQVRSNLVVWEYRQQQSQAYIGWQQHELVRTAGHWRIRRKFIHLLDCDQPQGNNTFIL